MKKHFLLLMLMALLPFSAFAASLDPAKFTAANISYGTSDMPKVTADGYTETTDYTVDAQYFYKSNTGEGQTAIVNLPTTASGKYYVKITGAGDYVRQTVYVDFWINEIDASKLTIINIDNQTYTGSQIKPTLEVKNGETILALGTDYTVEYSDNINIGTATATITGKGNFSGTNSATFTISAKPFNKTNISVEVAESSFIYNGNPQAPVVTVKDIERNVVLTSSDYLIYYNSKTAVPTDAANDIEIKLKGKGNYAAGYIGVGKYNIDKATLLVKVTATKEYDGTANLPTLVANNYKFQGLQGTDEETVVTYNDGYTVANAAQRTAADAEETKVGNSYGLEPVIAAFKATNYKFAAQAGTFSITQKPINITVDNKEDVPYGTADNAIDYTINVTTAVSDDEANVIKATTKVTKASEPVEGKYALTVAQAVELTEDQKAVLANYDPTYDNSSNPYLTYSNGELTIALNEEKLASSLTKEYDGQDAPSTITVNKEDLIISGLVGDDQVTNVPTVTVVSPDKDAKAYQVNLSGATCSGSYNINYVSSKYVITKKALKITAKAQVLKTGQSAEKLSKTMDDVVVEGLVEGEGIASVSFNLATSVTMTDAGVYKKGIEISGATAADGTSLDNYDTPTYVAGDLTVQSATAKVLNDKSDLTSLVASTGKDDVTFTTRQLTAYVWTTMVLPFETSVREISAALGYAVVDMLDTDPTSDDMNFKLWMGTIPAYTPFLVKTDEDVDMNTVQFADVKIEALGEDNEANLTQSNKSYSFIGNMNNAAISSIYWTAGSKMTADTFTFNKYRSGTTLAALRAYIVAKNGGAAAPRIYIEEPNGTVTAINGVSNETVNTDNEGLYNLNGMKIQGVPTQKGIYIKNGKKVVIK